MKGYEKVKEMLESQLDDYTYFSYDEIEIDGGYEQSKEDEYYKVEITKANEKDETLCFHYNRKKDILEIELGEDNFQEITTYDWRVKYCWMALLKW